MKVAVGCEFIQHVDVPTHAVVQVEPHPAGDFTLSSATWSTAPELSSSVFTDGFGNVCRRLTLPPGTSILRYSAVAERSPDADDVDPDALQVSPEDLPADSLVFTLPSRYCPSDVMAPTAWELFGATAPGWARVQAVADWVHSSLTFRYGASIATTSALDVFESRTGVCRDFAHLFVTFCRALGFPTRYAFGYLPDIEVPPSENPMDFCAWTEVFVGGRWFTFDPRNNQRRKGRVLIGRGRDALDVAMVTTFGAARLDGMTVVAEPLDVQEDVRA